MLKRIIKTKKSLFHLLFIFTAILFILGACKKQINYFEYVSELRSNIYIATTDEFTIKAYYSLRESPYLSDGIKQETEPRLEIYLYTLSYDEKAEIKFEIDKKNYQGEMSYDNSTNRYYYIESIKIDELDRIDFTIIYGDKTIELTANSVIQNDILTAREILDKFVKSEPETISLLSAKGKFLGEFSIRLIEKGELYYYIGVFDKNGNVKSYLLDAKTGKILAKR